MPESWKPEKDHDSWSDRDAWRGNVHLEGAGAWQCEIDQEWTWENRELGMAEPDEPDLE